MLATPPSLDVLGLEHTLGTALEQLEHRINLTCPRPFWFRPFPLLFFVILVAITKSAFSDLFVVLVRIVRCSRREGVVMERRGRLRAGRTLLS